MTASTPQKKFQFEPDITGLEELLRQFAEIWQSFSTLLLGALESSKEINAFEKEKEAFYALALDLVEGNESPEKYKSVIRTGCLLKGKIKGFIEKLTDPETANLYFDQITCDIRLVSEEIWQRESDTVLESRVRFTAVAGKNHKTVVPAYAEVTRHLLSMKRRCQELSGERKREQELAKKQEEREKARARTRQMLSA